MPDPTHTYDMHLFRFPDGRYTLSWLFLDALKEEIGYEEFGPFDTPTSIMNSLAAAINLWEAGMSAEDVHTTINGLESEAR